MTTNVRPINTSHAPKKSGPQTPAGKVRSSINALRHGLSSRTVVLPSEDMALYLKFAKDLVDSLHPATPIENEIAQTIADGYWRLKRVRTTEESLYALGHDEGQGDFTADHEAIHAAYTAGKTFRDHSKAFVNLSIYEQRIQRSIEKNMKMLKELQSERKAHRQEELRDAVRLLDLNKAENLPWEPAEDGFVYSREEVEREARRRERAEQALSYAFSIEKNQAAA